VAAASSPAGGALARALERRSALPPRVLRDRLAGAVAPIDGGFTLVSKLSGGGIVTRTLRAPETDRPLFGRVEPERIRVALVHRGIDTSPFQPIVRVELTPEGEGTRVRLALAPHPNARTFGGAFAVGAILLLVAAGLQVGTRPGLALATAVFAVALGGFPHLRARVGFGQDADRVVVALAELLELEPAP
jgi:hypothetical protein